LKFGLATIKISKMTNNKEYILSAAVHFDDGKIYEHQPSNIKTGFVVCGRRLATATVNI
jgi:hypothetical protein